MRFLRAEGTAEHFINVCQAHVQQGSAEADVQLLLIQVAVLAKAMGQRLPSALARRLPVQSEAEQTAAADRLIRAAKLLT